VVFPPNQRFGFQAWFKCYNTALLTSWSGSGDSLKACSLCIRKTMQRNLSLLHSDRMRGIQLSQNVHAHVLSDSGDT